MAALKTAVAVGCNVLAWMISAKHKNRPEKKKKIKEKNSKMKASHTEKNDTF